MAPSQSPYIPDDPKDFPLRPLSKGMRRDIPSTSLEVGEFYDLKNALSRKNGLYRRQGLLNYLSGSSVTLPPIVSMDTIWKSDGTQSTSLLDSRMLYYIQAGYNLVKWAYSTGTVAGAVVGGVTVLTGAGGTAWTTAANDLKVGDVFYCGALTGTNKWGLIRSIDSATQITLETNEGTAPGGSVYEIRRSIWGYPQRFPDLLSVKGKLLIADGRREVRAYDPGSAVGTYTYYSTDATFDLNAYCLAFFKDRLFVGRTVETGVEWRQRVRWTTALSTTVLPALQFVDLPYSPGHLRRLLQMSNTLIAYLSDAIYIGRMTNLFDALPVAFDTKLDTGGIGLAGDRALISALGGHFFVGDDNIYFLADNSTNPEAIGDPIKDIYFSDPEGLWSSRIEIDPDSTRLLFTMPSASGGFNRIFSFDYRAKAWSYEEVTGTFVGRRQVFRSLSYDTWLSAPPYTYDTGLGVFPTYDSIGTPQSPMIFIGSGSGLLYYGGALVTTDSGLSDISVLIESGDIDFQDPDNERVTTRLSVKLQKPLSEDVTFTVKVSNDEGMTWKLTRGRALTIRAGFLENFVTFRLKGSTFRFRLESSSSCAQYCIQEIVLRATGAGVESHLPSNA